MTHTQEVLCLYELDLHTHVETGRVTFYCSRACREAQWEKRPLEAKGVAAMDTNVGIMCDNCGQVIQEADDAAE